MPSVPSKGDSQVVVVGQSQLTHTLRSDKYSSDRGHGDRIIRLDPYLSTLETRRGNLKRNFLQFISGRHFQCFRLQKRGGGRKGSPHFPS